MQGNISGSSLIRDFCIDHGPLAAFIYHIVDTVQDRLTHIDVHAPSKNAVQIIVFFILLKL